MIKDSALNRMYAYSKYDITYVWRKLYEVI